MAHREYKSGMTISMLLIGFSASCYCQGGGGLCRQSPNYQELGKMFHCLCHL